MTIHERNTPFRHWILEDFLISQEACLEINDSIRKRPHVWKMYDNGCERKRLVDSSSDIGPACRSISRPDWARIAAVNCGLKSSGWRTDPNGYGGSIHAMLPGDYLGCHIDRAVLPGSDPLLELRLAIVVFLVPEWREEWGGHLQFWDASARNVVASYAPTPGRVIIWEPSDLSYHGVSVVSKECPVVRATANCFLYASARPGAVRQRALFIPPRG